jgi:selenocysteine-specific translation elongation factor
VEDDYFITGVYCQNHDLARGVCDALGAPGTKSDLFLFNRLEAAANRVTIAIDPIAYPEKLKPFLQVLRMASVHLLLLDAEVGIVAASAELMVGIEIACTLWGGRALVAIAGVTPTNAWRVEEIQTRLGGILPDALKTHPVLVLQARQDLDALRDTIYGLGPIPVTPASGREGTVVLIDHAFPVKGIGTVALGIVDRGVVNAGAMYEIVGVKKTIVRSIQKSDREFKEAHRGDRVGLALKGIEHDLISRNTPLATPGVYKNTQEIQVKLYLNRFFRPSHESGALVPSDRQFSVVVDLAVAPAKVAAGDPVLPSESGVVTLSLGNPIPVDAHGFTGFLAELTPFENRLRIAGHFESV